jgi:hypothetical protein
MQSNYIGKWMLSVLTDSSLIYLPLLSTLDAVVFTFQIYPENTKCLDKYQVKTWVEKSMVLFTATTLGADYFNYFSCVP